MSPQPPHLMGLIHLGPFSLGSDFLNLESLSPVLDTVQAPGTQAGRALAVPSAKGEPLQARIPPTSVSKAQL